jgi:hypothetical protein
MDEERKPWEQLPDEPDLWYGRFRRFFLMAFGRSVSAVFKAEVSEGSRANQSLEVYGYWYEYAKKYNWQERAAAYDANWIEEQDKIIAQEKEKVLRSGFALQYKRIQSLDRLLNKLIEMTDDEDKIWIPDVKAIGNGPGAERVDLVNFNAPLFTLIDKYKASLAAEMGERVKKKDITVTELPPNVYFDFNPDDDGTITQDKGNDDNI